MINLGDLRTGLLSERGDEKAQISNNNKIILFIKRGLVKPPKH